MADQKLTQLTEKTQLTPTDLTYVVQGGSSFNSKISTLTLAVSTGIPLSRTVYETGTNLISGVKTFQGTVNFLDASSNTNVLQFVTGANSGFLTRGFDGKTSVDFGKRYAFDQSGSGSLNWQNRFLYDNNSGVTVDWNNRWLYDTNARKIIDWGQCKAISNDGAASVYWSARWLADSSSNTTLDWGSKFLMESIDVPALNWGKKTLSGNWIISGSSLVNPMHLTGTENITGAKTFRSNVFFYNNDTNTNVLEFTTGAGSAGTWLARGLEGNTSIDFENRTLTDASNVQSVNWDSRLFYDNSNVVCLGLNQRSLFGTDTFTTLDWSNRILYSGNPALNWKTKKTFDDSNNASIDWHNKQLINVGTTTIDWSRLILSGVWSMNGSGIALSTQLGATGSNLQNQINNAFLTDIVRTSGTQTISGSKTFNSGVVITDKASSASLLQYIPGPITIWRAAGTDNALSVDFQNRTLNSSSTALVSWAAGSINLYDQATSAAVISISSLTFTMQDFLAVQAADIHNRTLSDSAGVLSLDWTNRQLKNGGWTLTGQNILTNPQINTTNIPLNSVITNGNRTMFVSAVFDITGSNLKGGLYIDNDVDNTYETKIECSGITRSQLCGWINPLGKFMFTGINTGAGQNIVIMNSSSQRAIL